MTNWLTIQSSLFCQVSLHEYPGKELPPDPLINKLKDLLMDMIGLGSISTLPPNSQFSLKEIYNKIEISNICS